MTTEEYIQRDREIFTHLLRLAVADTAAQAQSLDTSEEFSRLIPILCTCFSREELVQLVGEQLTAKILEVHRLEALQNLFLEAELQRVLRAFNEAGIPLMLFKGPALAHTIYSEAHLRTYHDIDVLIHPGDLPGAHELLVEMGYSFYEEFRANAADKERSGYNYVLARPNFWLEVQIELHTAPHSSEIGTQFESAALWERAQPIVILGEQTLTMYAVDHLLYLCWHYRFHGFTRLLWLYDVVVMLRTIGPELDWTMLVEAAHHLRLATTLYYCLSWCRDLFGVAVPEHVFTRLCPTIACRWLVERIAMPNAAQALAAASWQARRIIAQRVMVDSASSLFQAGIQAFIPAPVFMRQRYMNHSRVPLQFFFFFYLVHPWITLVKGLGYLLSPAFRRRRS